MWSQCYNVIPPNFRSQKMGKIRQLFTAREKLKVISYAEAHGSRADGREFNMNETQCPKDAKIKNGR